MFIKKYQIHLIGIGGIGMSNIATMLHRLGYKVTGSDIKNTNITNSLQSINIKIFIGHKKENIKNANIIIFSSAIPMNNVEIKSGIKKKIPIISRSEMLNELIRNKYSIAISGSHGKTSTTSILRNILKTAKLNPTTLIGGIFKDLNSNIEIKKGKFVIIEADESDGSLINYNPTIIITTNIDKEHINYYKNINNIKKIFIKFLKKIPFYGYGVLCMDDINIQKIIPKIKKKKIITYGITSNSNFQAKNISFENLKTKFYLNNLEKNQNKIELDKIGIHNIYNTLASISVSKNLNIPISIIKKTLIKSKNIKRRIELLGKIKNIIIIDDYAHHPTEILTTINTININWPNKRKIVIFQPHRYSRLKNLFKEFIKSFKLFDILIILPTYPAGEKNSYKINSKKLYNKINNNKIKNVIYSSNFKNCLKNIKKIIKKNDLLITLGAGNINKIGKKILNI